LKCPVKVLWMQTVGSLQSLSCWENTAGKSLKFSMLIYRDNHMTKIQSHKTYRAIIVLVHKLTEGLQTCFSGFRSWKRQIFSAVKQRIMHKMGKSTSITSKISHTSQRTPYSHWSQNSLAFRNTQVICNMLRLSLACFTILHMLYTMAQTLCFESGQCNYTF